MPRPLPADIESVEQAIREDQRFAFRVWKGEHLLFARPSQCVFLWETGEGYAGWFLMLPGNPAPVYLSPEQEPVVQRYLDYVQDRSLGPDLLAPGDPNRRAFDDREAPTDPPAPDTFS